MIISNVEIRHIRDAGEAAGILAWAERRGSNLRWRVKCRPRPGSGRFYRRGQSSCWTMRNVLCWHGFKAFFDELFKRAPEARVYTAFENYRGAIEYEAHHMLTGLRNIWSQATPVYAQDACDCAILAQPLECQVCGTREGVTYKRHGWESMTVVCKARVCRRAVRAVRMLRGEE